MEFNSYKNKLYDIFQKEKFSRHLNESELIGYIDHELEHKQMIQIENHLSKCEICRTRYEREKLASQLISPLNISRNEFVSSINAEQKTFQVNRIIESINNEKPVRNIFSIHNSHVMGSVFAGVVVLFIAFYIFNSTVIKLKQTIDNELVSQTNSNVSDNKTANFSGSIEAQEKSITNDEKSYDEEGITTGNKTAAQDQDNLPSSGMLMTLYGQIGSDTAYIDILSDNILYVYETNNTEYAYIGVATLYQADTSDKSTQLSELLERMNISAEIKTITGENSEKLLEYVSKDALNEINAFPFEHSFDYLVVLIGR